MTTRIVASLLLIAGVPALAGGAENTSPALIPRPVKMELREGTFTLGPKTAIVADASTRRVSILILYSCNSLISNCAA